MNALAAISTDSRRREFKFSLEDHRAISKLAYKIAGILLPDSKAQMVYGRLAPRVRANGLQSVSDYLKLIERDETERDRAIDMLTTNHTSFFREKHHFEHFSAEVWPTLLERLRAGKRVRLWSAACSSGEEPYTWMMAMLGAQRAEAERILQLDLRMLATDLSASMLDVARAGIYPHETVKPVPEPLAKSWLQKAGDSMQVDPALRAPISFLPLNLLGDWPMRSKFDVICCRNVMIYFDGPTKARLQARMADQLEQGGTLYIGHSERLDEIVASRFECVGNTTYRKIAP